MSLNVEAQSSIRFGGKPSILDYSDSLNRNSLFYSSLGYNDETDFIFKKGKANRLIHRNGDFSISCRQKGLSRYLCKGSIIDSKTGCAGTIDANLYTLSRAYNLTYTINDVCSDYTYSIKVWVVGSKY